ncbi:MAG: protein kinase domain-containing protein, partial [Bryobacteraceae bacterium]
MTPAEYRQLKELYAQMEECVSQQERTALLNQVEAEDPEKGGQLRALWAHRTPTDDWIEHPVARLAPPAALPATIGRYRIMQWLGEGGMGIVYEAEQDNPRRRVAVKIIKHAFAGPELLRRFEREAEVLGRLHHPGIAQIYEAATGESGGRPQPYFAMELIRGESLLRYAEEQQLSTRPRLELMIQVCEAVQHAHQYRVIHRDLKPANILVEEGGRPKILDFGVARLTESDTEVTRQTYVGQLVGTPAYMSPEQVGAEPQELDERSDVYALGVILYELLAGRLPYPISPQLHDAARTIREQEPVSLRSVHRAYRGDLEIIVAKALEKDRDRRYSSAADLARDLEHYLRDEPIAARRPSAMYQLRKFARRHKALVGAVVAVFVVLIAGIIASTGEARRARQAEQVAQQTEQVARQAEQAAVHDRDRAAEAEQRATQQRDRALSAERAATLAASVDRARLLDEEARGQAEAQPLLGLRLALEGLALVPPERMDIRTPIVQTIAEIAGRGRLARLSAKAEKVFPSGDGTTFVIVHAQGKSELRGTAHGARSVELTDKVAEWDAFFAPVFFINHGRVAIVN